jgi:hypothetical protein
MTEPVTLEHLAKLLDQILAELVATNSSLARTISRLEDSEAGTNARQSILERDMAALERALVALASKTEETP